MKIKDDDVSKNRFVITGNLSAMQTEVSLLEWLKVFYPILKEVYPNASLTIAGKNPSSVLQDQCSKLHITLIPSPKSMEAILQNADYYICPTNLGGGLKLRIMDGLKWGLPVISHKVSARGYDIFEENGILFSYKNRHEFKDALLQLQRTNNDKKTVIELYKSYFSFEAGCSRVCKVITSLGKI